MQKLPNALEISLISAASEPANRPEFYKLLLNSRIYVIGHSDNPREGESLLPVGSKLSIINWEKQDGTPAIPFFTSIDALRNALKEEAGYVAMPAKDLFEMTRGSILVLNPSSTHVKEFSPTEIDTLLSTGINRIAVEHTIQEDTKVLLGQPSHYPLEMVLSLSKLLTKHPTVKAAYLCLMSHEKPDSAPSLVVGVRGAGDIRTAMKAAGTVAADTAPKGAPVDFIEVKIDDEGISEYFLRSVQPFYERSWVTKLRSMLPSQR